jgi:phosphohistidine phosphatase
MELYLLRHGIAADLGEGGVTRDADRPLTDEGRAKMKQEAKGMKKLGLAFDLIFTSPLVRTRQTAEIVAEVLSLEDRIVITEALAPGRSFMHASYKHAEIFLEIGAHECSRALLVGHQPDMSEYASILLHGQRGVNVEFKKGALCAIEVSSLPPRTPGALLWLLTPRQLKLIAES